jgi:hypothetical protein
VFVLLMIPAAFLGLSRNARYTTKTRRRFSHLAVATGVTWLVAFVVTLVVSV